MAKFFINRPIVAIVIAIIMVIVGAVSFASLPTAQFPDIVPPEILVQAILSRRRCGDPGAVGCHAA